MGNHITVPCWCEAAPGHYRGQAGVRWGWLPQLLPKGQSPGAATSTSEGTGTCQGGEENQRLRIHNPAAKEPCAGPSSFPPYSHSDSHPTAMDTAPILVLIPPLPGQTNPQGLTPAPHTFPIRDFSSIWPNWSQSLLQLSPTAAQGCDSTASQPGPSTSSHKSVTDQSMAIPKGSISIKQGAPWITQG